MEASSAPENAGPGSASGSLPGKSAGNPAGAELNGIKSPQDAESTMKLTMPEVAEKPSGPMASLAKM
jgi:hypothetical protein